MSVEEQVRSAASPQEALLALARGLDAVLARPAEEPADAWGHWSNAGFVTADPPAAPITTEVTEDAITVTIAPVDELRKATRRQLAEAMGLTDEFGEHEDWTEVYAKGGPLWLYNTKRDFVISLPVDIRAAMVADLAQDDAATAQDVGRDLLKDTSPQTQETALPMADIIS